MPNEEEMIDTEYKKDVAQICAEAFVAVVGICVAGMSFVVWMVTI